MSLVRKIVGNLFGRIKQIPKEQFNPGVDMKVCFVYIYKYKNLKDVGLALDSHFLYHYDKTTDELLICDNDNHIDHFYGNNIYSLCVIAGNNGAGKSNAIRFILNAAVEGLKDKSLCDGIVVFRNGNDILCYYSSNDKVKVKFHRNQINKASFIGCRSFFYSSHAMYKSPQNLPFGSFDILLSELEGLYNATESVRIEKDFEEYSNSEAYEGNRSYNDYLLAHLSQRSFKLLLFLRDYYSKANQITDLVLPPCVLILANSSGYYHFINGNHNSGKQYSSNIRVWHSVRNKTLYEFFITSMLNKASNNNELTLWQPMIDSWETLVKGSESDDVISLWEAWMKDKNPTNDLERILKVVKTINSTCKFDDTYGRFSLQLKDNIEVVNSFIDIIYSPCEFRVARYIDVALSFDGITEAMMSSGEEKFLYLMAELYYSHIIHGEKYDSIKAPTLYVFDEAELGYHPEWQRKFIAYLLGFFNHYSQKDIQIIMTTHSPILLSDVAAQDTVLLEKKDGVTKLVEEHKETFGTNIFELYKNSFFLRNGLMGEFATKEIEKIVEDIEKSRNVDTLQKRIRQIGDPQIRNYLTLRFSAVNKNDAIVLLNEQIQQINEGL